MRLALPLLCWLMLAIPALATAVDPALKAAIEAKDAAAAATALAKGADPNGTWMHDGVGLAPPLIH
ncbi:MAG TPA: hypothetical protein VEI97_03770, partial [bacterium]|nr:hypothetical protein [bacterium]